MRVIAHDRNRRLAAADAGTSSPVWAPSRQLRLLLMAQQRSTYSTVDAVIRCCNALTGSNREFCYTQGIKYVYFTRNLKTPLVPC